MGHFSVFRSLNGDETVVCCNNRKEFIGFFSKRLPRSFFLGDISFRQIIFVQRRLSGCPCCLPSSFAAVRNPPTMVDGFLLLSYIIFSTSSSPVCFRW